MVTDAVFKKNLTDKELEQIRVEMDPIMLDDQLSIEEQVLFVIDQVKEFERKYYGLTDEEIVYKYTHRDCSSLATLIELVVPGVVAGWFHRGRDSQHAAISIEVDEDGNPIPRNERYFYDINGKQSREEISQAIIEGIAGREYMFEQLSFHKDELCHTSPTTKMIFDKIREGRELTQVDGL